MVTKKNIVAWLFLFLLYAGVTAQNQHQTEVRQNPFARFKNPFPLKNPELGQVLDICQDNKGFIWIAGTEGLLRFDGTRQRLYQHGTSMQQSLPSSEVICITIDYLSRLWIGTSKGLSIYDYSNDGFITMLNGHDFAVPEDSLSVRAILAEGDSLLWVDMLNGYLWKIDINSFKILERYYHTPTIQPYYYYSSIWRSPAGKLWVGGRGFGPYYLNKSNQLIPLSTGDTLKHQKRESDVAVFYTDAKGVCWVGGLDGLYRFDENSSEFTKMLAISTFTICEGPKGGLWIGTGSGIFRFDSHTNIFEWYLHNEDDPHSLPDNDVNTMMTDRTGRIWAGCKNKIGVHDYTNSNIRYFFHIPGQDNSPVSSSISDLELADDKTIWIGTADRGLDKFEPENQTFTHYNPSNVSGMPSSNIRCILKADEGNVYCGFWSGKGFGLLNPEKRQFKNYSFDPKSQKCDWYNDLAFDKNGHLYLGFWGAQGLLKFNTKTNQFGISLKDKFEDSYFTRLITRLYRDGANNLWVGTTQTGIHCYFPEQDTSYCYYTKFNPSGGFGSPIVHDIIQRPDGQIIASGKGIYYLDIWSNQFRPFALPVAYKNVEVFSMLCSSEDYLWLMSEKGLLLFNTHDSTLTDYSQLINLEFGEKNSSGIQLPNKQLLLGGINGMAMFHPDSIFLKSNYPGIYPVKFSVFDKALLLSFSNNQQIELMHNENFISLQFGSDYWYPDDPFVYEAILQNFDREWNIISSADKSVSYTNVPSGKYYLRIRASDHYGRPGPAQIILEITIKQPYWNTWWFITAIVICVFLILGTVWRLRIKQIQQKLTYLENDQKLMRVQMNPHFIFNSLTAIQNYIYTQKTHEAGQYLSDFAKLIRHILDNSRYEYISLEKELETIQIYLQLQQHRFQNPFQFKIQLIPDLDPSEFYVPPMMAQPFLENAIEHGIKQMNEKGEISITYKLSGKLIRMEITDNGMGLTASVAQKSQSGIPEHESVAIALFKKRHKILQKKHRLAMYFSVKEIYDDNETVIGTQVIIDIPYTFQQPKIQ